MSTYQPGDRTPIAGVAVLREALSPKAPVLGRVGIEWELLPLRPGGAAAPYAGGVDRALNAMAASGFAPFHEGGSVVGLDAPGGGFVALEPGGQVEFSSLPRERLEILDWEMRDFFEHLREGARGAGWEPVPLGLVPRGGPEDLPDVPKARYAVLADHLRGAGRWGRWMMKLTASTQISLDTPSLECLSLQTGAALRILPYLTGWMANSPGGLPGAGHWKTRRTYIWRHTDRRRCSLPDFLFRGGDAVSGWVRYGLSRPVIFLVRDGRWMGGDGRSFREWLGDPGALGPLTLEDWALHCSSLFPDIRFRGYLEIRAPDSVPREMAMAAAALCKGLLGDPERAASWAWRFPDPDPAPARADMLRAARGGGTWVPCLGPAPEEAAKILFGEARAGLAAFGEDGGWLDPLERLARNGHCPADALLEGGSGPAI